MLVFCFSCFELVCVVCFVVLFKLPLVVLRFFFFVIMLFHDRVGGRAKRKALRFIFFLELGTRAQSFSFDDITGTLFCSSQTALFLQLMSVCTCTLVF